ncbi:MAG: hypothetical protein PHD54_15215 [Desulfuromonadaceae bacterium]|nr:hypothetical protein [Desulfuromonadaceae bacterium]
MRGTTVLINGRLKQQWLGITTGWLCDWRCRRSSELAQLDNTAA